MADRLADTRRLYAMLADLENRVGGMRRLADSSGRLNWPARGLYFFCEAGEIRSGGARRIVRVGTHGLKTGSRSTLWGRLSQHRGTVHAGGGNHRGSIFRLLIGIALARRDGIGLPPSWGIRSDPSAAAKRLGMDRAGVKRAEADLEAHVSRYIGVMPFLWLDVGDAPGPASERGVIERNAIALLSGYRKPAPDPPSPDWLGHSSDRERVRRSGLWNNNHVDEAYDPSFLDAMERRIGTTGRA